MWPNIWLYLTLCSTYFTKHNFCYFCHRKSSSHTCKLDVFKTVYSKMWKPWLYIVNTHTSTHFSEYKNIFYEQTSCLWEYLNSKRHLKQMKHHRTKRNLSLKNYELYFKNTYINLLLSTLIFSFFINWIIFTFTYIT